MMNEKFFKNWYFEKNDKLLDFLISKKRIIISLIFLESIYQIISFQQGVDISFLEKSSYLNLQSIFSLLATTFLAFSAIIISLMTFVVQINIERMPYGLFKQFRSKHSLEKRFFLSILLALYLFFLSVLSYEFVLLTLGELTFCFLSLVCFLLMLENLKTSFFESFKFIDPMEQLKFILCFAKDNLNDWSNKADNLEYDNTVHLIYGEYLVHQQTKHDFQRVHFFQKQSDWISPTIMNLVHCNEYAKKYALKGDTEVSYKALRCIFEINKHYISVKGKTFFTGSTAPKDLLSRELVFETTLELFRKNMEDNAFRQNEAFWVQQLDVLLELYMLFFDIDYSQDEVRKNYSDMVYLYIKTATKYAKDNSLKEVVGKGIRSMTEACRHSIKNEYFQQLYMQIPYISDVVLRQGSLKEDFAIARVFIDHTNLIVMSLIACKMENIREDLSRIQKNIEEVIDKYIDDVADTKLTLDTVILSLYLTPSNEIRNYLQNNIINLLSNKQSERELVLRTVNHILQWGESISDYQQKIYTIIKTGNDKVIAYFIDWIAWHISIYTKIEQLNIFDDNMYSRIQDNELLFARVVPSEDIAKLNKQA